MCVCFPTSASYHAKKTNREIKLVERVHFFFLPKQRTASREPRLIVKTSVSSVEAGLINHSTNTSQGAGRPLH